MPLPLRAAQYLRMSTEHQQYSLDNQAARVKEYAESRGFEIVRTYSDGGRSGLTLRDRPALNELLQDVLSTSAGFEVILVYDISRWGRFQDADEAAHYEFLCRNAGIQVHYCAEEFPNDGTMSSTLLKVLKRTMAAEYSRELGVKVYQGQKRLTEMGFKMGSSPGYAMRRVMVSRSGKRRRVMRPGERKSFTTDRVILVAGPEREQEVVRKIYRWTLKGDRPLKIARRLNCMGIRNSKGSEWKYWNVTEILSNPKYCGCNTWGRSTQKLGGRTLVIPQEHWVRSPGVINPVVSPALFERVQPLLDWSHKYTNQQMLDALRKLLARRGRLSENLIMYTGWVPSVSQYQRRFGSLYRAYELIGYTPIPLQQSNWKQRVHTIQVRNEILDRLRSHSSGRVAVIRRNRKLRPHFVVDKTFSVAVLPCPSFETCTGLQRWHLYPNRDLRDLVLACLLSKNNQRVAAMYLICTDETRQTVRGPEYMEAMGLRIKHAEEIADAVQQFAASRGIKGAGGKQAGD
jgi:DNA invertase Pin-like site-specific DNA recombinase